MRWFKMSTATVLILAVLFLSSHSLVSASSAGDVAEDVVDTVSDIIEDAKEKFEEMREVVNENVGHASADAMGRADEAYGKVQDVAGEAAAAAGKAYDEASRNAAGTGGSSDSYAKQASDASKEAYAQAAERAAEAAQEVKAKVDDPSVKDQVLNAAQEASDKASTAARDASNYASTYAKDASNRAQGYLPKSDAVYDSISENFKKLSDSAKQTQLKKMLDNYFGVDVFDKIRDLLNPAYEAMNRATATKGGTPLTGDVSTLEKIKREINQYSARDGEFARFVANLYRMAVPRQQRQ